jgi:hypothetical protein
MAVAVTIDIPTGTQEKYDKVVAGLYPGGKLPEGWLLHMAGPIEGGWRVVNVVPSQEEFEVFARDELIPATQGVGDPPPQVTYFPVYRLIEAPNDAA